MLLEKLKPCSLVLLASMTAFAVWPYNGAMYIVGYIEIALIAISFQMSPKGKIWKYLALAMVILGLNLSEASFTILYRWYKLRTEWYEGASPPAFYPYSTLLVLVVQNTTGCLIHFLYARLLLHLGARVFQPFKHGPAPHKPQFTFSLRSVLTAMTLIAVLCVFPKSNHAMWTMQFVPSDIIMSTETTFYCVGILYLGSRLTAFWRNLIFLLPYLGLFLCDEFFPTLLYSFRRSATQEMVAFQLETFAAAAIFVQAAWAWISTFNIHPYIMDSPVVGTFHVPKVSEANRPDQTSIQNNHWE